MSTNEERREAAKRKLEARLEADRQAARKRRNIGFALTGVVVVVIAAVGGFVWYRHWDDKRHTECTYADAPAQWDEQLEQLKARAGEIPANQKQQYDDYVKKLEQGKDKDRTSPKPESRTLNTGTVGMTLKTNQGEIPMTLDRAKAPCNVNALISLSEHGFYDNTSCHRLVTTADLGALQCGDPTGTGMGGPGWTTKDEEPQDLKKVPGSDQMEQLGVPASYVYPRGTLAIANSNNPQQGTKDTGSAQFFIVTSDAKLPNTLSIVGHVDDAGMKVVDKVAKAGPKLAEGAEPGQGGPPILPVDIKSVSISE
ncbi:MAG: peptidylprolyl isomerase [Gordonia sp. (in: high G+C Gram-positive bacteria)]